MKMEKTMIKFEEHYGMLFSMLEKPLPLKEKDTNVLVQFITHGVIGEYVMEHWLDCGQENAPIFVDSVDSDGDVTVFIENGNEHHCCPFPMFEIIGTLVKEGSKEWALYQMMQGKKVCNPTLAAEKATRLGSYEVEQFNTFWYIVGDTVVEGKSNYGTLSVSSWIAASSPTGWQLYEEPKIEPPKEPDNLYLNIKPSNPADWCFDKKNLLVLVDDNFKGIVGENVTREQVGEIAKLLTEPAKEQFKVGDWVTDGVIVVGPVAVINDGKVWVKTKGAQYHLSVEHLRKLSPSEVIVKIGCLSGTVNHAISDDCFLLAKVNDPHHRACCIDMSMLDNKTRELVESLLKAQEEE